MSIMSLWKVGYDFHSSIPIRILEEEWADASTRLEDRGSTDRETASGKTTNLFFY